MPGFILHPKEPPAEGMVRQKALFPITKKLAIKPDTPAILECYNFVYTPPPVPPYGSFKAGEKFIASMTYAFSNYPTQEVMFGNTYIEGPHSTQILQEATYRGEVGIGFDYVFYGIGYPLLLPDEMHLLPPTKKITTQTWRNPRVGTVDQHRIGVQWLSTDTISNNILSFPPWRPAWGTDYVMWIYDWDWLLDGEQRRFDPLLSLYWLSRFYSWEFDYSGVDDGLFLPGQMGARVISKKYWDAPWERYPHLI